MKKLDLTGPLHAAFILLEQEGEYEKAIIDYLHDHKQLPCEWGGSGKFNLDQLVEQHRVIGNRQSSDPDYPKVLVINMLTDTNQLIVNFVPKTTLEL